MRFRLTLKLILLVALCLLLPRLAGADALRVQDFCLGNGTQGPFSLNWKQIVPGTETVRVNGIPQMRGLDYTLDIGAGTVFFTRSLPTGAAAEVTYQHEPGQTPRTGDGLTIPLNFDLLRSDRGYFSLNALGRQGKTADSNLTLGVGLGLSGGKNAQLSSRFLYTPASGADAGSAQSESATRRTGLSLAGTASAGGWTQFAFGFSRAGLGVDSGGDSALQAGRQLLTLSSRLSPVRRMQAEISFRQSRPMEDDGAAVTTDTALALNMNPNDTTEIKARLAQSANGTSGMTQMTGLSLSARPLDKLQLSADYAGRDAPGTNGDSQAVNLKTVLSPAKTVSLETTAAQSRQGDDLTSQQGIQLSLKPTQAVQLQAGLALRQKGAAGAADTLETSVASVGGVLRPLSFLEVSGSYKDRTAPDTDLNLSDGLDTSTAKVALAPLKTVRLVGTYAQNPDDGGGPRHLARKGVGLETHLGALGLSGGYDWSRAYDAADVEETIHADMGLRFSAATQIKVGFQTRQNALDPATPPATAYTLGFSHTLGDRFSFSLNGKRAQTSVNQADYDATANLGMKF